MSKIEWTDATWNPVVGCSLASPGCTNCYAMRTAWRLEWMAVRHDTAHSTPGPTAQYLGTTKLTKAGPVWTGTVNAAPDDVLMKPLRWKKPRRIFVNSMSDLFHPAVPDAVIDRVFAVMALCPKHQFQVLTKRSDRMREYCTSRFGGWGEMHLADAIEALDGFKKDGGGEWGEPLPNVWLGVSVEDQARADERMPDLLATPAAVRWISAEPLLGPVDLKDFLLCHDAAPPCAGPSKYWVVAGGESGPGARPMHPDWARSLRDQCAAAGVPFLFKQWGEWRETDGPKTTIENRKIGKGTHWLTRDGLLHEGSNFSIYHDYRVLKMGKRAAGRTLDGVLHDGYPA